MRPVRFLALIVGTAVLVGGTSLAAPPLARAVGPVGSPCLVPGSCSLPASGGGLLSGVSSTLTAIALSAFVIPVVSGATYVLDATAKVLSKSTSPQLTSTWFSATYWRVAAIAAVLTLPFLFAAGVQALVRSDLSLLLRSALGYLPLAFLAVAITAPLTMLLLAATDQMSAVVSSTAGNQGAAFLERAAGFLSALAASFGSPFVLLLVGLLTVAGALVLWIELLVREAAVYVIVLMLPLAFAAFVWPARRIWVIRSIELLVALILSKFAIVAVLSLGGAALAQSAGNSITGLLAGAVLMALAAFAPWAMLRVVPLTEIASSAATSLGAGARTALGGLQRSDAWAAEGHHWATTTAQMRDAAGSRNGASANKEAIDADRPVPNEPPPPAREAAAPAAPAPSAEPAPSAKPEPSETPAAAEPPQEPPIDIENQPPPPSLPLPERNE